MNTAAHAASARTHTRAWLFLVVALAVHVVDEALTGFLDFYNPLVRSLRERIGWFPTPTFTFDVWLTGLVLLVLALALVTPWIRRGGMAVAGASWAFSTLMFLNGLGHLLGSAYFGRWLPGVTSAPLLLVASAVLAFRTSERRGPAREAVVS
jgi:hypothetical protein